MIEEIEKEFIRLKMEKISYYNNIKDLRAEIEVDKAALKEQQNMFKRQKRLADKKKSVITDAAETRKTFVIGLPRTLSFPEPKNATA
jgi:hypothetical protein